MAETLISALVCQILYPHFMLCIYGWCYLSPVSLKFLTIKLRCTNIHNRHEKIHRCFIACTIPKFWLVIIIIILPNQIMCYAVAELQLICDQESEFWVSSPQIIKCQLVFVVSGNEFVRPTSERLVGSSLNFVFLVYFTWHACQCGERSTPGCSFRISVSLVSSFWSCCQDISLIFTII